MKEEIFNSTLQDIKTIFHFLMEGEPSPDDEIEAREKLIDLFSTLRQNNTNAQIASFIVKVLEDLENWDTLDLWFKEVDSLIAGIKKILDFSISSAESKSQSEVISASESSVESKKSKQDTGDELIEIVAQVSEQFKGQIESLKEKIEALQVELDKKSDIIEELNEDTPLEKEEMTVGDYEDKNLEKETLETIQDTKNTSKASKLEPPKIHIPKLKVPSPITKDEDDQTSFDLSDMEDTLKELSSIGDALQEMSETKDISEKPNIVPEAVEEEKNLSEIPQMNSSELKKLPKSLQRSSETENGLNLSEVPKRYALEKSEKKKSEKKKKIIPEVIEKTPNKSMLTEIPKMVPNQVEKSQDLQIETKDSISHETEEFISIPSQRGSNKPKDSKKKVIVPNVIEETNDPNTSSLEGSLFIPDTPKTEVKGIKLPNSQEESPNEKDDAIFMIKKPSVKLEEIKTESIKTTRSDLFDVFSSIPDHEIEDNKIETEALLEIDKTEDTEEKGKKSKKKDKKKDKSKKDDKISKKDGTIFDSKVAPEKSSTIDYDNLPNNKEILYQDLIALEGKRYSIEKTFKELEIRLTNRNINENDFRKQSNDLTSKLKEISSNITKLRNAIAKM